jgi:hypothetical protein
MCSRSSISLIKILTDELDCDLDFFRMTKIS